MGRYVRRVLRDLAANANIDITLLVRDVRNAASYHELVADVDVAPLRTAQLPAQFGVVWYPWNGVRFTSRAPAVVTINDDFAFAFPAAGRVARWREQRPIRRATRHAKRITTISDWSRRALIERFALEPQRVSVIPLAPDPIFTRGDDASPYPQPFVLAVGTREERKNIGFLIDVFARAFPAGDIGLVLIGGLDEIQSRRAREAKIPLVELIDVDDALLRRLYRTATVVAVPSLAEGFGLVAVEAQACGAAVIAANTSALPEAVGIAGILLDPRDLDAWTTALRQLVRDDALNAYYRAQSLARWPVGSGDRTSDAVLAALQSAIDDST